ncbi:MAG TPA: 23S rRNA (adenine(1618)-N(6))-methyltransferase RlmF [Bacteroidia bacterium]|jgi:23S rRNA (adenine1618-N6)-methyltransferase|nr:23S rRNA (adenine(1618)-N(6))-methyltransferase RlmF [Bacteroidia bacterium]
MKARSSAGEKTVLHPRNKHRKPYNFTELTRTHPPLQTFVKVNEYKNESIDFFNPDAVKALNKALLFHDYKLEYWDIPKNYLCPPIPGRADYIHYIADLLGNNGTSPKGSKITCLDIGVGANCIYPIIGSQEYGWSFIGADIDPIAIASAKNIVEGNDCLIGKVDLRLQKDTTQFFTNILKANEFVDVTICNPPFHLSAAEAYAGNIRKLENLKKRSGEKPLLNFAGKPHELWCNGGEERFVRNIIFESKAFAKQCGWFTSLVAKQTHLKRIYNAIEKVEVAEVRTIPMGQGNKVSRIVAWRF